MKNIQILTWVIKKYILEMRKYTENYKALRSGLIKKEESLHILVR